MNVFVFESHERLIAESSLWLDLFIYKDMNAEKRPRLDYPDPSELDNMQLMRYVVEFKRRRQQDEAIVQDVMLTMLNAIIREECRALVVDVKREAALPTGAYYNYDGSNDVVLIKDGNEVNEPPFDDLVHFKEELDELTKTRKWLNSRISRLKRSIRRCEEAARREEEEDDDVLANIIAAGPDPVEIVIEDIEP